MIRISVGLAHNFKEIKFCAEIELPSTSILFLPTFLLYRQKIRLIILSDHKSKVRVEINSSQVDSSLRSFNIAERHSFWLNSPNNDRATFNTEPKLTSI